MLSLFLGNSRNASFEQMILKNTKGSGVDVVLNSLAADLFQASIRCVGHRGRFLEIGKVDLWAGTPVSASLFSKNTSFHGVLLDDLCSISEKSPVKQEINRLLSEGKSHLLSFGLNCYIRIKLDFNPAIKEV